MYWNISLDNISHKVKLEKNLLPSDYEADMLRTIWLKAWAAIQVANSLPILIGVLHSSVSICGLTIHINRGANPLPSDNEAYVLTVWLKALYWSGYYTPPSLSKRLWPHRHNTYNRDNQATPGTTRQPGTTDIYLMI